MIVHLRLVLSVMLLGLILAGCSPMELSSIFEPHSLGEVPPDPWSGLRAAMTKQEVASLLGESSVKGGPTTSDQGRILLAEFWEYGWTEGLPLLGPSPRAHVVYFGENERVIDFRGPREEGKEYPPEIFERMVVIGDYEEAIQHRQEGAINPSLPTPIAVAPADRAVFDHHPREVTLQWKPAPGAPADVQYYVQVDATTKGEFSNFGDWVYAEPTFTLRTSKCSMTFQHMGAHPGRWRVKTLDAVGESPWSEWQYFRFSK